MRTNRCYYRRGYVELMSNLQQALPEDSRDGGGRYDKNAAGYCKSDTSLVTRPSIRQAVCYELLLSWFCARCIANI